jgi:hypothetical protein
MNKDKIKEMIRQSILAELSINEDTDIETGNSDVGLKDEYDNTVEEGSIDENAPNKDAIQRKYNEMFGKNPNTKISDVAKALGTSEENATMALMGIDLSQMKLEEAEEEEVTDEETVDIEAPAPDVPADIAMDTTMVSEPTYTPEEAAVMSSLDDALKGAQGLNDEKLSTLIGNIITYFTRSHVVKEGSAGRKKHYKGAVKDDKDQISKLKKDMKFDKKQLQKESLEMLKMKKLAGLLTEGEYAKALLRENLDYTFEELKGKTVILALIEDDEENKEFIVINTPEDYKELEKAVKQYEDMGILDEYYPVLNKGQRLREEDSDVYMSFDKEKWFDKEDKPYAGGFDFDYDEETFDDFDSFISKYSDKQKSFRPADKSMFDMYKNKYNNMMMRKRK